jgi:hypothetical protein
MQLFESCRLCTIPSDERLRYVLGQVLGVQDFQQEQHYFLHKDRLHARALHGYGTISGLAVSIGGVQLAEIEVQVAPGLAQDTCGQLIAVAAKQCAALNPWLAADSGNGQSNGQRIRGEDGTGVVHVTLAYAECETGHQPVFGDPCRSDDEAIQPTRLKDDFRLSLDLTAPAQTEEDAIRAIGGFLGRITITGDPALPDDQRAALLERLRAGVANPGALAPDAAFALPREQARELLRETFLHWVLAVRPALQPAEDRRILLATLRFPLGEGNQVADPATIAIDETRRPYLLATRLLQEWLLSAGRGEKGDPGEPGRDGQDGRDGVDGAPGRDGVDGQSGRDGEDGQDGAPGRDGRDGRDGRGLDRIVINPNMMIGPRDAARVTRLSNDMPHPLWRLNADASRVSFNWGWSPTWPNEPRLRIYWTTREDMELRWQIRWRWTRAIRPGDGPDLPATSLNPEANEEAFEARSIGAQDGAFQLNVGPPVALRQDIERPDYLFVEIILAGGGSPVDLLLAEISLEEAQ